MTGPGSYHFLVMVWICLICSTAIIFRCRHYLQPRKPSESWPSFRKRAIADRVAYEGARENVWGGLLRMALSSSMLLGAMFLAGKLDATGEVTFYVIIGMALATKLREKPDGWNRVTKIDHAIWRINNSWLWPVRLALLIKGKRK